MSRLLRVELRRFSARRLVRWAAAGTVALAVLTVVLAFLASRPASDAQVAAVHQAYESELALWESHGEEQVAQCERDEEAARQTDPGVDFGCEDMAPQLEWFLPQTPTFEAEGSSWTTSGAATVGQLAPLLLLFALVAGVTFLTAEISTGAIGLWLTFEPRRQRVYWTKAAGAALGVLPVVATAYLVMLGGAYGAYALNGQLGPVTGDTWVELAGVGSRAVVAAALVAATGAALGVLLRNAAGALGAVVVWVVVVETVAVLAVQDTQRWLVRNNVAAWVQGDLSIWLEECTTGPDGTTCQGVQETLTLAQGGLYLLGVTAVLSALAVAVFRRRDVA